MTAPLVVIDAGHGGKDPGAVRKNTEGLLFRESDVAWAVSVATFALLSCHGVEVQLARDAHESVTLRRRTDFANNLGADLYVSIHCNSHESTTAHGFEVLQYREGSEGSRLAHLVEEAIAGTFIPPVFIGGGLKRRGVKSRPDLWILRKTAMPACLVELPFISNPAERVLLARGQFQARAAKAIAKGVLAYLRGRQ